MAVPAVDRVLRRIRVHPLGCWEFQGACNKDGYGGTALAHRVVYEEASGPVPEALTLDHWCFNRRCVNPAHLRPMPQADNCKRSWLARRQPELLAA